MDSLLQIRQHLGLTQANIATYLSVSVSLVKMVEAGQRELPNAANLKLMRLELAVSRGDSQLNTHPPAPEKDRKQHKLLHRYLRRLEKQLQKAEKELLLMQQRYQQALNRSALIPKVQTETPIVVDIDIDTLWLDLLQTEARTQLENSGLAAQAIVQWKMDTYIYSISQAKALLEKMGNSPL